MHGICAAEGFLFVKRGADRDGNGELHLLSLCGTGIIPFGMLRVQKRRHFLERASSTFV